jgi:hypothetical protein
MTSVQEAQAAVVEKMEALLDNVRIEQRVFARTSRIMRDDNGAQLGEIAAELEQLAALLVEFIKELGAS